MVSLPNILLFVGAAWANEGGHAVEGAEAAGAEGHHGIPWSNIALHTVNLVILLAVLWKFALPMVRDALANRSAGIRREIDEASRLHTDAAARYEALEARLNGLEKQLVDMRAEAERDAEREQAAILARADKDAAQVAAAAERTIRSEVARARQELREDAARLAVSLAEAQIAREINPADEERFARSFLSAVKGEA